MAVLSMQKVALVAHRSKRSELIDFLHKEGVMEITGAKDADGVLSQDVPYQMAELKTAIATLKRFATKQTMALLSKKSTERQIMAAGKSEDIRQIIDELHTLEHEIVEKKKQIADLEQGRLPGSAPVQTNESSEGAYFTASDVQTDVSNFGSAQTDHDEKRAALVAKHLVSATKDEERAHQKIVELSKQLPLLVRAEQYLLWKNQAEAVSQSMNETKSTVTLFGWIPASEFDGLEKRLTQLSPATALVKVEPRQGEDAPVKLNNPAWLRPFESVTGLYGLPLYAEKDPTMIITPFFILFYSLCLTDAGYGLVQAIVMGLYLWKKKLSINEAPLWWTVFLTGIAAFFVGIPFGGWFGMPTTMAPSFMTEMRADGQLWFKYQIWNLGAQQGIAFLQNLALSFGVVHITLGIILSSIYKWMGGSKEAAFFDSFGSALSIIAGCVWYFAPEPFTTYGLYTLGFGSLLMFWGKGAGAWFVRPIIGFLQTIFFWLGLMGNVLSYLRILALGLVTGAIAMAVDLVAQQIGGMLPVYLGIPVAVIILLIGHAISIGLNVMGGIIHAARLQFVEFFSQFFEGGGRAFKPFRRSQIST